LPLSQIVLKAKKPLSSAYPKTLKTLGNHLKKRRLDLNLLQIEVAQMFGVCNISIYNWEKDLAKPAVKYFPKIIKFIGHIPFGKSTLSIGEKIILYRKLHGLSQKKLACQLGIDPCTLSKWERNKRKPYERFLKQLEENREN
jgi:transcriptional regulator with XRE-family HTH domain